MVCACHGGELDVRTREPLDGPVFRPTAVDFLRLGLARCGSSSSSEGGG